MTSLWDHKQLVADPDYYLKMCSCHKEHPRVDARYHLSARAFELLAQDCRSLAYDSIMLLDDQNTHAAAGKEISKRLTGLGVTHETVTLAGNVSATEAQADEVERLSRDHQMIIAIGAGTINDLAKFASAKRELPYWCAPTAPSMNGFTSSIAAIKIAGVKRTLPAPPPQFIYTHPQVIAQSPPALRQSGFCDVLAKSVSDFDWRIESLLFSSTYCRLPSSVVSRVEDAYLQHPEAIASGDPEVVEALFVGLLASGAAMTLAGSSAPASGGEHLVSHFFDMREKITGNKPNLHGLQVAAGIVLSAACYQQLAKLDQTRLGADPEEVFARDLEKIPSIWGELAPEVEKRFQLKQPQLMELGRLMPENWPQIATLCAEVKGPEHYASLMRRTGYALTLKSLGFPPQEFLLSALNARTIRERITVLDIAAQAGVLRDAAEQAAVIMA